MKSKEKYINKKSNYYVTNPADTTKMSYPYVISIGHFYYEVGYSLYRDCFDSVLLIYVINGKLKFNINPNASDSCNYCNSGEVLILNCYLPHHYEADENCEIYFVHADGKMLQSLCNQLPSFIEDGFYLGKADSTTMNLLVNQYYRYENKVLSDIIIEAMELTTIFGRIALDSKSSNIENENKIIEAKNYIDNHFMNDITLDALSETYGFSKFHFLRIFKEYTSYTPHEYLAYVRLNNACYMLKNTNMSIKDICFSCGYSSPSVFTTAFKNKYNMTPQEYKRN